MPAEASSSAHGDDDNNDKPSLPYRRRTTNDILRINSSKPESSASAQANGSTKQKSHDAIANPGTIKINVQGAFIVDDDAPTPCKNRSPNGAGVRNGDGNGSPTRRGNGHGERDEYFAYQHDTSDIRLPNHTATVSHIAVDVRFCHVIMLDLI